VNRFPLKFQLFYFAIELFCKHRIIQKFLFFRHWLKQVPAIAAPLCFPPDFFGSTQRIVSRTGKFSRGFYPFKNLKNFLIFFESPAPCH